METFACLNAVHIKIAWKVRTVQRMEGAFIYVHGVKEIRSVQMKLYATCMKTGA